MSLLSRVNNFVEGLLERKLSSAEKDNLEEFVNTNYNTNYKKEIVQIAELATEYVKTIQLPQEINISNFLGLNTFDEFISNFNPKAKRKTAYMCLDSRYAQFNTECTKLTWSFTNNLNTVNNSTNVVGPVRDITSIRMHSMVVRKFNSIPQRATVLIEELSAQAFILPSGRRFHFVGLLNDLQVPVDLINRNSAFAGQPVPDFTIFDKYELLSGYKFNEGYYRFNKPITTLDNITVSIGNPDTLVVLPKYEFKNITVLDVQTDHIDLELNEPHYYISPNCFYAYAEGTWYSVFVDGFNSTNDADDAFINGTEFTLIEILGPTKIRVIFHEAMAGAYFPFPYTMRYITASAAPWSCLGIRFNSYRVIMNFELEYISD